MGMHPVTITGGAVEALAEAGQHAASFLARHARGDWGENGHFDQIALTDDERRGDGSAPTGCLIQPSRQMQPG